MENELDKILIYHRKAVIKEMEFKLLTKKYDLVIEFQKNQNSFADIKADFIDEILNLMKE